MRLTGAEYVDLEEGLRDAFVDYDDLASALRRTGTRLGDVAAPGPMPQVLRRVIEHSESRDSVHELVAAARAANPTNTRLLKLSVAIGLEPGGIDPAALPAEQALGAATSSLERMVDQERGIADLGSFAVNLGDLVRRVCAVEFGHDSGTGFLIGPRTVLTNYHVVQPAIAGAFAPADIVLRFDYQRLRDGRTTNGGVEHRLADDWLVHAEPYSALDTQTYDEASVPADNELDYAVLRTRDPIGSEAGADVPARGWLAPKVPHHEFAPGSFLMVVQHPCRDPLSFDFVDDAVLRVNRNATRVHYTTNTMPGSSGSPVLDRGLELVALHHAGEPGSPDFGLPCAKQTTQASYNEGIPIAAVQEHLTGAGHGWVFGADAP